MNKELIKQAFKLGYQAGLEKLAQAAQPDPNAPSPGLTQYRNGIYASSPAELRAANTPELLAQRRNQYQSAQQRMQQLQQFRAQTINPNTQPANHELAHAGQPQQAIQPRQMPQSNNIAGTLGRMNYRPPMSQGLNLQPQQMQQMRQAMNTTP